MALDDSLLTATGQGQNPIEATLDQWNNETIKKLQESLDSKASSGTSQMLRQSIEPQTIQTTDNGLSVEIVMEDYYKFIDVGVKGIGRSGLPDTNESVFNQKAPDSPWSFKAGRENKPSASHFKEWANGKGINPFVLSESIWRRGIKANHFYSDVINESWISELVTRLEVAGAGTVEVLIINELENGNNN